EHAAQLAERGLEILDVPHAEAHRRRVERLVLEGKRKRVAAHPLDLRRLAAGPLEHLLREIEADHVAARAPRRDREIAGAAAHIEHAIAGTNGRLDRDPPPAPV